MKLKIYPIVIYMAAMICAGCNDWLDVQSRSESREDDLYSAEEGFKASLTGVYIQLAKENMYGRNTSYHLPDILAQLWIKSTTTTELTYILGNWNFTNSSAQSRIETIWNNYYNNIAQLNNLLENLETTDAAFRYGNELLIEGEARGLRAFLHFEVLRLFGPIPALASPEQTAVPYVTSFTTDVSRLVSISYSEVLNKIKADLDAAEELLSDDPIILNSNNNLNTTSAKDYLTDDVWQRYRQSRFNYYAVLGTKARFYSYIGEAAKAVEYAKRVIEAVDRDGASTFTLATASTIKKYDYIMHCESMFSLHSYDLQNVIDGMFVTEHCKLTQNKNDITTLFEGQADDIRYSGNPYWEEQTHTGGLSINHFLKYADRSSKDSPNYIPLLRVVEMYFIVIENAGLSEAQKYFQTYCSTRALDTALMEDLSDATTIRNRLEKEYMKEFYGEGQLFYFYKKHRYLKYTWPIAYIITSLDNYAIPKPDSQAQFE